MTDRCPTCHRKHRRSNPANARYWLVLHVIADKVKPKDDDDNEQTFSAPTWHRYFKARYLGCTEVKLPNGKTVEDPNSTADLAKDEFADYALKVEQWGMEHGAYLEEMPA